MTGLQVQYEQLSKEALQGLVEDFVTRDGTDYGESEIPLETKVQQVMNQLHSGKAIIVFDQKTETCNIVSHEQLKRCINTIKRKSSSGSDDEHEGI